MPAYVYRCGAGHEADVTHPMLYTTGVVCACGEPMQRVPQAPRINWNGGRAGQEPAPAVQQLLRTAPARRDEFQRKKAGYEEEKRRLGRD